MNSPFDRFSKAHVESSSDMSPVTDLALNMKCLTTTLTETPNRRISWSDPFPNKDGVTYVGEYSPCTDSPMLQEILLKNKSKVKQVITRKILPFNCSDKENLPPKVVERSESIASSGTESTSMNDSQDSGYSSACGKSFSLVTPRSPHIRVKSSVFKSMPSEDFYSSLFLMEEDICMEVTSGPNVNSLLTKPLCNLDTPTDIAGRRGKLPTRRCLTLEMDNSEPMNLDMTSKDSSQSVNMEADSDDTELPPLRKCPFKRPDPYNAISVHSKRRKSSPALNIPEDVLENSNFIKQRSFSETAATIMQAVQISDLKPNLIGDCSRCYALPVVKGRHQDLKCISSETLVQLLKGEYEGNIDSFILVDCR